MSGDLLRAVAQRPDPSHVLRPIKIAQPSAGAEFTFTVPGEQALRVISVTGQLVTSAVAANRAAALVIGSPDGTVITVEQPAVVTASLTTLFCWADGVSGDAASLVNGRLTAGIGEYVLPAGYTISSSTGALDAGDQWQNVLVWAEVRLTQPHTTHAELLAAWIAEQIMEAQAAQGE